MKYRRRQIMQNNMIIITGGDGSSEQTAIVIRNAKTTKDGVNAEYEIVAKYFGVKDIDWKLVDQSFVQNEINGNCFDILRIEDQDGQRYAIWFDITDFFGK